MVKISSIFTKSVTYRNQQPDHYKKRPQKKPKAVKHRGGRSRVGMTMVSIQWIFLVTPCLTSSIKLSFFYIKKITNYKRSLKLSYKLNTKLILTGTWFAMAVIQTPLSLTHCTDWLTHPFHVVCHMSHDTHQVSHIFSGGSVINGACPF